MLIFAIIPYAEASADGNSEPVVMLIQAIGQVLYSPDGKIWEKVYRNRFLYDGYLVKTGKDGACRFFDPYHQMIQDIQGDTEVKIHAAGIVARRGRISEPASAGGFMSFFQRKFTQVRKYAVIRREDAGSQELKTVPDICLSEDYPDLVWENMGQEYAYQLVTEKKTYDVSASDADMVRFRLNGLEPGVHSFHISVMYQGEIIDSSGKNSTFLWLSDEENRLFREREKKIREIDPDNGFLMGNVMDEYGFSVAAMDQFRKFLAENPDIHEVRPFLIKIYSDLGLERLRQSESVLYHQHRSGIFSLKQEPRILQK
ncbi:MAG: hypothetical protein AB7S75_08585 [Desulfococcaceae bacterium]